MLCSPWFSCCCHFYCLRKCFCLKSLHFQSLCTDHEYSPKVTLWRKQERAEGEGKVVFKRVATWWNFLSFYTQELMLEINMASLSYSYGSIKGKRKNKIKTRWQWQMLDLFLYVGWQCCNSSLGWPDLTNFCKLLWLPEAFC